MTKRQLDELLSQDANKVLQTSQTNPTVSSAVDIKKILDGPVVQAVEKSIVQSIFVVENGVISFSLRALSILFSVLMTGGLLYTLKKYCESNECTTSSFPMVEDTLIFDE